jgi:phage/plasmid-like protein (TIGR03299 family)
MSRETLEWLNCMTLIGNTAARTVEQLSEPLEQRGWHKRQEIVTADAGLQTVAAAWHYRAVMQGAEPNHYAGFIPVPDVTRRLFNWTPVRGDFQSTGTLMDANGVRTFTIVDENRVNILRPPGALSEDDPGAVLGTFKKGYKIHDFNVWLLENVSTILDDELGISAAGLLGDGVRAWVEVSVPEAIKTPEGVEFRPNLLAATSLDGSIATGYGRTVQLSICDNTLAIARREKGQKYKVKHSKNSMGKLPEVREALALVHTDADDFRAEVAQLCDTTVTDSQWERFLSELHSTTDEKTGKEKTGASRTYAINRRDELDNLYRNDPRCAPWAGSAFGVLQTVNTHAHHVAPFKGDSRAQRNMEREIASLDSKTLSTLDAVLASA